MDAPELHTHSFVVRIWLEETAQATGRAVWRGHITHVPSGNRKYLSDLREIERFITPYLEEMGIRPTIRHRVSKWLSRWKRR
jgi:hypothetical protein